MADLFRTAGFRGALGQVSESVAVRADRRRGARFDRRYGVDTSGHIPLGKLGISSSNAVYGVPYEPVTPSYFSRMVESVTLAPGTHVFVDLGSGKGRALMLAASYPFKRIVGVEFSPRPESGRGEEHRAVPVGHGRAGYLRAARGGRSCVRVSGRAAGDLPLQPVQRAGADAGPRPPQRVDRGEAPATSSSSTGRRGRRGSSTRSTTSVRWRPATATGSTATPVGREGLSAGTRDRGCST